MPLSEDERSNILMRRLLAKSTLGPFVPGFLCLGVTYLLSQPSLRCLSLVWLFAGRVI
jgi:hypothetical protein